MWELIAVNISKWSIMFCFTSEEQESIEQGVENASDAIIDYLENVFNNAMNRFN